MCINQFLSELDNMFNEINLVNILYIYYFDSNIDFTVKITIQKYIFVPVWEYSHLVIDYGDGTIKSYNGECICHSEEQEHTYRREGVYNVVITGNMLGFGDIPKDMIPRLKNANVRSLGFRYNPEIIEGIPFDSYYYVNSPKR